MKSKAVRWITGIVTGATTLVGAWTGWMTYEQQSGGVLSMQYNGEVVSGVNHRNLVICVDSTVVEKNFSSICPNFYNSRKYTVRDLSLRYRVESEGIQFEPTGMYNLSNEGDGTYILRYTLDKLASYETTSPPIRKFIIPNNGGAVTMCAMASFDGADSLMTYQVNVNFLVVDNAGTQSFNEWQSRCQQMCNRQQAGKTYDAYYVSLRYGDADYCYNAPLETKKHSAEDAALAENMAKAEVKNAAKDDVGEEKAATESSESEADKYDSKKFSDRDIDLSNVRFYSDSLMHVAIRRNGHQAVVMLVEDSVEHRFINYAGEFFDESPAEQVWIFPNDYMLLNFAYLDEDASLAYKIEYDDGCYENKWSRSVAFSYYSPKIKQVVMEIVPPKSKTGKMEEQEILRYYSLPEHVLVDENKQVFFWNTLWNGYKYVLLIGFICFLLLPLFDSKEEREGKTIAKYYKEEFFRFIVPVAIFLWGAIAIVVIIIGYIMW